MQFDHTFIGTAFTFLHSNFTYTYLGKDKNSHNLHKFLVEHTMNKYYSYINDHSNTWPDKVLKEKIMIPISIEIKKQIHAQLISRINNIKDLLKLEKIQQKILFQDDIYIVLRAFLGDTKIIKKKI
jgi:hypothetical protein